jgi:site-specific DNA recombinase
MHWKNKCPSKQIPEDVLNEVVSRVMNLKKVSLEELKIKVAKIVVLDNQQLTIYPKQGVPITTTWKHISRRESWTVDMKEKARQRVVKGKIDNEKNNSHPTND